MHTIQVGKHPGLSDLFHEYTWNYLAAAVLEGHMGQVLVDDPTEPHIAALEIPGLELAIIGGDAAHPAAEIYLHSLTAPKMMVCASPDWETLLNKLHKGRLGRMPRYAFSSESLDQDHLQQLKAGLAEGYRLEKLDLELATMLAEEKSDFSADHLLNFKSPQDFVERGFGFCVFEPGSCTKRDGAKRSSLKHWG